MKSLLIGLDLGTTNVKAGLYDLAGQELAVARESYPIIYPAPERAEQDPRIWRSAVFDALARITKTAANLGKIEALGLSAQCPGHVVVDGAGEPVGNAIIWQDRRAVEEASWLAQNILPAQAAEWVGCENFGDATSSPARLLWMKNHRGGELPAGYRVLQPKDYLGFLLTGEVVTDLNTSYLLVNPATRAFHPDFLHLLGLDHSQVPRLRRPTELLGTINVPASAKTGLTAGTPVYVGTIDAYCDTLAAGGFIPGQAVDVAGTSEIVSLGSESNREGEGIFLAGLDGLGTFLCGPMQAGCGLLSWLASAFYPEMGGQLDFTAMESAASEAPAGSDGLIFLPYIHGERAPIWDPGAKGAFLGITGKHDRRHFTRAVYEGIAFAIRHVLETCENVEGRRAGQIILCGGGASSPFWNRIKASVLQRKAYRLQAEASACLGAAMLAGVGAGLFADLKQSWNSMSSLSEDILVEDNSAIIYDQNYIVYRSMYPTLQTLMAGNREG